VRNTGVVDEEDIHVDFELIHELGKDVLSDLIDLLALALPLLLFFLNRLYHRVMEHLLEVLLPSLSRREGAVKGATTSYDFCVQGPWHSVAAVEGVRAGRDGGVTDLTGGHGQLQLDLI
jgi:hypothetical protein